jgi:lysozyme family protein
MRKSHTIRGNTVMKLFRVLGIVASITMIASIFSLPVPLAAANPYDSKSVIQEIPPTVKNVLLNDPILDTPINGAVSNITEPPSRPDLIISEIVETWVNPEAGTYSVRFTVKNIGNALAPSGYDVNLTVDNIERERKVVFVDLAPGATYSDVFTTINTLSGFSDIIVVRADINNRLNESDEFNNSQISTLVRSAIIPDSIFGEGHRSGQTSIVGDSEVAGGTISGYVYQTNGTTPVAGASVSAYLMTGSGYYSYGSDIDGNYNIVGLPTGNYLVYASATGYIREYYNSVQDYNNASSVSVTAPNNTPNINFTLDLGATISGRVYRNDGTTPVAGAHVWAELIGSGYNYGAAVSDADGNYSIVGLPTGNYLVYAGATGYIREYYNSVQDYNNASPVSVTAPNNTPNINFTLDLGATISGRVYCNDGTTPVAYASVYAELIGGGYGYYGSATSDASGNYSFVGLQTGNYRVWAMATGYITEYYNNVHDYYSATPVSITAPNNTPNINFTLDLGATISGRVYLSDDTTPIAGAYVSAGLIGSGYSYGESTFSDANGNYTIVGLPTGNYRVSASATGYFTEYYNNVDESSKATPVSVTAPNNTSNINFTLDLGATISGRVYLSDGTTPIAGAWVIGSGYSYGGSAYSDASGNYSFVGLQTGNYRVWAGATGYLTEYYNNVYDSSIATLVSVTAPNSTPNINFTLDLGATISGRVYRADGTTPVAYAYVSAELIGSGYSYGSDYSDTGGNYSIVGLPTGNYRVSAGAAGYLTEYYNNVYDSSIATLVSVTAPNSTPYINITLDLGAPISGRVYRNDGTTPVANAYVRADLMTYSSGYRHVRSSYSDASGNYSFVGLQTGNYRVYAMATGYITEYYNNVYESNNATPVSITAPNNTPNINFTLDLGATISGRVYRNDGTTPVAYAYVATELISSGYNYGAAASDTDGNYTIAGLPTGNYRVFAVATGYLKEYYNNVYESSNATPVSVTAPNNTPNINFTLDLGATISGRVYLSDGTTPIASAYVSAELIGSGYSYGSDYSDTNGDYSIVGLLTGNYRVSAVATGYPPEYYNNVYESSNATPVGVTAPNNTPNINFTLGGLSLASIAPNVGPVSGGTTVTIKGLDFMNGATVTIGGSSATSVTFGNATTITAVTPAGTAGPKDVVVTNPNTRTSNLVNGFNYIAPPSVNLSLITGAIPINVGSTFDVVVKADAGAIGVAGVDAFLNFDPAKLTVLDMDSGTIGIQIIPGTGLNTVLKNVCNNTSGIIDFSAGKLNAPFPNGTFTVATIRFQAIGATPSTTIYFSNDTPRLTSVTDGVTDVTGTLTPTTVQIIQCTVNFSVLLQGGSRQDSGWVVPLTVKFFTPGADVMTAIPVYTFNLTTTKTGSYATAQCTGVLPGNYDITAVSEHTLLNVKRNVTVIAPSNTVNLGTLLEGNANNNNLINIQDFGLLATSYGKVTGDPLFSPMADFDRNGTVNIQDFGLLATNYLKIAPIEVP